MKILVSGNTKGNLCLLNKYIKEEHVDFAVCSGDFGISLRNTKTNSDFYKFLEGREKFVKPVITIRGANDNLYLYRQLCKKSIQVDNLTVLRNGEVYTQGSIKIGGIGGTYSPKCYSKEKLVGGEKRHFTKKETSYLYNSGLDILLMHDFMGGCSKRRVKYSEETLGFIEKIMPYYCVVGKYDWWGASKMIGYNIVVMPSLEKGYLIIDSNNEWNSKGVRFDL